MSYIENYRKLGKVITFAVDNPGSLEAELLALPEVQRLAVKYICPQVELPKTDAQKGYDNVLKALRWCVEWNEEYKKINNLVGDPWAFSAAKQILTQETQCTEQV